ncbi:hypothetical protein BN1708_016182 [Verticillium longisporum]|uniref:Xylanolytic transcriptional activator regulatory domain-containing protein n=1 Tax=Verticillium longisporum TaxID=100787 RepID=A0A0G4MFB5_VERLO|nr:hypothetical protein BN1708_016182 [Verticillium longisporum]
MFVASASFVDDTLLTQDFYTSRTSLKCSVYQRAKVLYDLNYEQDKITLIQSVFLMGFWYTTSDDRQGPWHWNGIAISLSHTIGLHRLPKSPSQGCGNIQPFWRGLWWSICCREVWLSLGQGRPMRIPLDDMDTPEPGRFDAEVFVPENSTDSCLKYLPGELSELNTLWMTLVKLSITLGTILSTHYRAKSTKPTRSDVEYCEREIRACSYELPATEHQSGVAASHRYQFRIYFEATIIVLYRPFILEAPRDVTLEHEEPWRALACQKTRVAASNACSAVTSMMAEELIGLSHTITVIALVPPMHVHLFESASSKPLTSQMGKHNLALCMLAMSELRKSYISATAAYKLFEAAIKKIDGTRSSRRPSHQPQSDAVVVDLGAQEQAPLSPRESWPEGYSALSANVISDAWMWPNMLGSQNESWLDNQDLVGLYEPGDFTQALDGWT